MTPQAIVLLLEATARAYVALSRATPDTVAAEVERVLPGLGDALDAGLEPQQPPPRDVDRHPLGTVRSAADDLFGELPF